jgi:hypothetical protein
MRLFISSRPTSQTFLHADCPDTHPPLSRRLCRVPSVLLSVCQARRACLHIAQGNVKINKRKACGYVPYIWMRTFMTFSDGWGILCRNICCKNDEEASKNISLVSTKFYLWAVRDTKKLVNEHYEKKDSHFFIIIHRSAFPTVWDSSWIWNVADDRSGEDCNFWVGK